MRNRALQKLDMLLGNWTLTLSNAWFLDSLDTQLRGAATIEWLGDAFVVLRSDLEGDRAWDFVIGRSDPHETYTALYHDKRGVCRVFQMTSERGQWKLAREDPDFYQRFVADVEADRISGRWEMSEDQGRNWRTDFDLTFQRVTQGN